MGVLSNRAHRHRTAHAAAAAHHRRAAIESLLASLAVGAIVVISLRGLWRTGEQAVVAELRQGLMRLAGIAASTIDPALHAQLSDPAQIDTPLYDEAIAGLRRARMMTPGVKYMYTAVRDGDRIRFVLDAAEPGDHDFDGREDRAQVWEIYRDPDPELIVALGADGMTGPATASAEPHSDEWGTFMTGYAPIVDQHGRQIGVAGVDVTAEQYRMQLSRIRREVMVGLVPGALVTLSVGLGVFLLRCRQLASLRAAEQGERRAVATASRLAESERRFRTLADCAPMMVWSSDAEGRCDFVNRPWCDFVGSVPELELGNGWLDHLHPDDRETVRSALAAAASERRAFEAEYRLRRNDGTYRLVLDKAVARSTEGAWAGFIGAAVDITELRQAEDEMKRAFHAAQAADRAKSEFLANMSHEIRTPLTTILGYAEVLRSDGDAERAPPARLQAVRAIQSAGEHLLTIINDVLDLSKIEAGCMRVERVETELAPLLRGCLDLVGIKAREKGLDLRLRFETPVPSRVSTDPTRLRQILLNLLSNAIKFTRAGGVTVRCRSEGDALIIEVEDTGVGLSAEQGAALFRCFSQADATVTRVHGGTGLGLVICRRLATLMGGQVVLARSEPGVGSCFTLRITAPATADAVQLTGPPDAPLPLVAAGGALARLSGRILLVEDGPDNRRLIAFHLRNAGASVTTAEHGAAALACVDDAARRGDRFDLVVTDMQMPGVDGLTLTRRLRERGETMPIIALTAHAADDEQERCLRAGCDDFASKPIDRASLLRVCAAWLGRRALVAR